jgi:hypothetical protein
MKYADLIRAALDGKTIQYQYTRTKNPIWIDFVASANAIRVLATESPHYEYRCKPEPKPDTVLFFALGAAQKGFYYHTSGCWDVLKYVAEKFNGPSGCTYDTCAKIKFTINGETGEQTVEIVK